jgi:DNA-binding transcriptional regulator YdaS (Cro superfamily)|nr:MAG TPA: Putative antitoxin of bacterial toxin-antitoxin system, YdaS/YdaT [Caudoviricetes sp.]
MSSPTPFEALQLARKIAGSQTELARICDVKQPTVCLWFKSRKNLPARFVLRVEAATGVSRHHLRPDIYPIETSTRFQAVDMKVQPVSFQNGHILQRSPDAGEAA